MCEGRVVESRAWVASITNTYGGREPIGQISGRHRTQTVNEGVAAQHTVRPMREQDSLRCWNPLAGPVR
jgi:hypothetical protein